MYNLKNALTKKPTEIAGAVISLVDLAIIVDWISMSADGVAALNIALLSVLGLFVANSVTSNTSLTELKAVEDTAKAEGVAAAVEILAPVTPPAGGGDRIGGAAALPVDQPGD